jgi:hypothetical protein
MSYNKALNTTGCLQISLFHSTPQSLLTKMPDGHLLLPYGKYSSIQCIRDLPPYPPSAGKQH